MAGPLDPTRLTRRHFAVSIIAALAAGKTVLSGSGKEPSPMHVAGASARRTVEKVATSGYVGKQANTQQPLVADAIPAPVEVVFREMFFDPSEITIPANTDVSFTFANKGYLNHDFVIKELSIFSGVLRTGTSATMVLNLPAGTYTYYCSQIGHKSAGMLGTLTVD